MASRKKLATSKALQLLLNKYMFEMVLNSEENEGFSIEQNVTAKTKVKDYDLTKDLILQFLETPQTKVRVVINPRGKVKLYAKSLVSGESIEIAGLGDHFIALVMIVLEAKKVLDKIDKRTEQGGSENIKIITHQFIQTLNLQLQPYREGEIGIGDYRYLDHLGRPAEVSISLPESILKNNTEKNFKYNASMDDYIRLETARGGNVEQKMKELVYWLNEEAFMGEDPFMDIANFHSQFIKIHPFRDGNGRTCRLLTNYFLMLIGSDLFDVNASNKEAYNHCLDFVNTYNLQGMLRDFPEFAEFYKNCIYPQIKGLPDCRETRLIPLRNFIQDNLVKDSSHAILRDIINYKGSNSRLNAEIADEEKSV